MKWVINYGSDFIHLISVYILILVAPGPDFAAVLRESLLRGRAHGLMAAFGVMCAVMIHCAYTILGLGLVIAQSPLLFNLIKWAGIAYLLYIGVKALFVKNSAGQEAFAPMQRVGSRARPLKKAFAAGFACNLLNPKCILFFLSIFSALIAPNTPAGVKALYAAAMALCCGLWFCCVAFFLTMPKITALYQRAGLWVGRLTGGVFIMFGLSLIFQKAQA